MDVKLSSAVSKEPVFLSVKTSDLVIIEDDSSSLNNAANDNWWMGYVICIQGGARKPNHQSMFQIADIDSGIIRWVNADLVSRIMESLITN